MTELVAPTFEDIAAGVVSFSSGNHAQADRAVCAAARHPRDDRHAARRPRAQDDATRGYGAEIVLYDRYTEHREEIGRELAQKRGLTLIPPFDHSHVIAGQGTAALELSEEVGPLDAER